MNMIEQLGIVALLAWLVQLALAYRQSRLFYKHMNWVAAPQVYQVESIVDVSMLCLLLTPLLPLLSKLKS